MFKRYNLQVLFFIVFIGQSFAQNTYQVQAKIIDAEGGTPSGNVLALNPSDSSFINGSFFLDGNLKIELDKDIVLLKITSIEFSDYFLTVQYNGEPSIDLGEIPVSQANALDGVIVSAKKPTYTRKADGSLLVTIENTSLSASSDLSDILSRTPEVVVDESGNFSVLGRGQAVYYLNGKRIANEQLSLIIPSNIKSIEIIRNPSAKYDAQGAAVINITTITNVSDGYQVRLNQSLSYSDFGGVISKSSAVLTVKKNKFLLNSTYSFQTGEERELLVTTRNRTPENIFLNTDLSNDYYREFDGYHNYGIGAQYNINKNNNLSLEYSGKNEKLGGNRLSKNMITDDSSSSLFETLIQFNQRDISHNLSLNYNLTLDTLGSNLFIGGQYSTFDLTTDNPIEEEEATDQSQTIRYLRNDQFLDIGIVSGQLDYKKYFNKNLSIETGAKFSTLTNDFTAEFLTSDDMINFELDEDFSNTFIYNEEVSAAYLSLSNQLNDKINYSIGLRAEYTDYNLDDSRLEDPIKDDYLNLFPNASVSFSNGSNKTFRISYVSRVFRALYSWLNPVLIYQDPFTGVQGNPRLIPEVSHTFELNAKLDKYNFLLGYTFKEDPFGFNVLKGDDDKSYVLTYLNHKTREEMYFSVSRNFKLDWFESRNTLWFISTDIINREEVDFRRVKPNAKIYYYTSNTIKLPKDFNLELIFWYNGVDKTGIFDRNSMYNVSLSLDKTFLDGNLNCRITANDIFHGVIASGNYFVNQTDVYFNRRWSTDYFRLSLDYKFGRLKKANYRNKNVGASETNRVN